MEVKELYAEYLGEGYHRKLRQMLTADENLLPDRIIDAGLNIGAMKRLLAPVMENMNRLGKKIDTETKFSQLSSAAQYYLAGVLCTAMISRTSAPPFNIPKYKKPWDKKRAGYMHKGNNLMMGLMQMG